MNNFAIEAEKEAEHVAFEAEKSHNLDTASSSTTPSSSDANIPSAPASNTYIPQSEKSDNVTNEKGQQPTKKPRRSFFSRKNKQGKEVAVEAEQDPLAHLPDHEAEILRRQIVVPPVEVGYKTLFRYSTRNDKLFMALGAVCAIIGGAVNPLMTVVFGSLAGTFQGYFLGTISKAQFDHDLGMFTLYFVYIAIAEFVAIYVATVTFIYTGEHMTRKIREQYLAAILRQNIGFFDKLGAGEITTRITADTNLIQEALSEKIGLTLTGLATFVTAFVIGFVESWRLTLILTSIVFAIVFSMGGFSKYIVLYNKLALDSYAEGGTVAEEVLSSIRNATAFSTQDKLSKQYDVYLKRAEYYGLRFKSILGVMIGVMMFIVYCNYALAFWQGSRYLVAGTDNVTLAKILTILLSMMIGAFQLGNVAPHMQAFTTGAAAGQKIFSTIDRVSPLDPETTDGLKPKEIIGEIELRNIKHIYPSRPEVVVMEDVSLMIPAGKTTALVGSSGSGKSTIVGLVERFYDPVGGNVYLDGVNVRDINLHYLRQNVALVSQEPTLFGTTIRGNIGHGLIGTSHENATNEEREILIIEAAKMANAHDFISALPEGYDTNVGERGFLLSGGQKQRIAIARAVVSDPKILLLDEATSALDTKSEGVVQAALDRAAEGRTTIVIAHRLSTIRNSHNIVVMSAGRIVEQGTHDNLLGMKGTYYGLVEAQQLAAATKQKEVEEEAEDLMLDPRSGMQRMPTEKDLKLGLTRTTTNKSVSSKVLKDNSAPVEADYSLWELIRIIAGFNKTDKLAMGIGLFASIIAGAGQPVQAVLFAKCIVALSRPPSQYAQLRSDINFWSGMFFMLAWAQFISYSVQGVAFAFCSERLIHRARDRAFRTFLRQDIGYFDYEENSSGALTSFLSTQTTHAAGLSGSTLGTILNVLTTLIGGFILALALGWKLSLVCISTVPILLACGYFRFSLLAKFEARSKKAYEKSASYACESTNAIRTVASLTREQDVWEHYHLQLVAQGARSLKSILYSSFLYAASQSFIFLCIALGFWYGGTLIGSREYDEQTFFIVFSAVIFGSQSAGTIFSFAPDMGKAKHAAAQLKKLFDRKPTIDIWSTAGARIPPGSSDVKGDLVFKDVHFRYPTRPEQPVLRGLDLHIKPGQYVALVGSSGCGKSTTIGLLERFYDPLSGAIFLDGQDISKLNLADYRSHLALVSQEPTLYQGTIRENILLGADHSADIPEAEMDERIVQACKDANIHSFITSLPEGFNTSCGGKGVLLSGGQKQRIAIARALLRNPKVLLLDEATSALDSESEKVVQAALDQAAKGRTTVAVAHRLSTVQHADAILVFDAGRIVERGTHSELMRKGGLYAELAAMQNLTAPV